MILSHESGLDAAGKQFALTELGLEYLGPSPNQGNKGDYFEVLEGANAGHCAHGAFHLCSRFSG